MTNLEIIKYLASNNPARLADFLNEMCYDAWDFGRLHRTRPITDWDEWLQADPRATWDFNPEEIEKWSKAIDSPPTITAFYDGLSVTIPIDDSDHLWNKDIYNGKYEVIDKAIDEIKLLENIIDSEKIPESVYNNLRKNMCAFCCDRHNCLRSDMDIVECLKSDENWEDWIQINDKENTK